MAMEIQFFIAILTLTQGIGTDVNVVQPCSTFVNECEIM